MGLDTVELVMEIEEDFGITFPDAVAENCRTVNDVAVYVHGQIQARPLPQSLAFPQVLLRIRQLTADQVGLPLDKVLPHSRFVEDLEMD